MKKIIYLIAAVLLIGVMAGLLIWQRNRPNEEVEAQTPTTNVPLIQRTENDLASVIFTDAYETVHFLPITGPEGRIESWQWHGVDYVLDRAGMQSKVRGAFTLFASQVIHEDIADVEDLNLAEFGLEPPIMTVTATYIDGTAISLYLGGPTPDMRSHFVQISGRPGLYTIAVHSADRLLMGLEDLVDRSLPIFDAESIDFMQIARRGEDLIEFSRQDHPDLEGVQWIVMQEPFYGREVFMSSFEHHVFEDFAHFGFGELINLNAANLAPYGLDEPSLEFIYRAPHGEVHLLFGDTFFREIGGDEIAFIYVKHADRPHVFETPLVLALPLIDINPVRFINRFIALLNIQDVYAMQLTTPDNVYEILINHDDEAANVIEPTINGLPVPESPFRVAYRLFIGLAIDAEVDPFTPTGQPIYTMHFTMIDEDDVELRFFELDPNFMAVSVNGEDAYMVTNRRNIETFFIHFNELFE